MEITLLGNADYASDKTLVEGVVAMAEQAGLRVIPNLLAGNDRDAARKVGKFDWHIWRAESELVTVVQNTSIASHLWDRPPVSSTRLPDGKGEVDLLDFEKQMVDIVNKFIASKDPAERVALMKHYQKINTENVYWAGLTQYPGALIINKRFANVAPGAPIFMYNWAEDNIIRERVYVPADKQQKLELYPNTAG